MPAASMPRALQGVLLPRDHLGFVRRTQARHGDVFGLDLPVAGRMVVVCDPTQTRRLAGLDPDAAHGGQARPRILGVISDRGPIPGSRHEGE
ncbi:MAG: hypothetical protein ACR2JG_12525 [Geodermatophilaceae bacterium]